jgi:hypothetical protein
MNFDFDFDDKKDLLQFMHNISMLVDPGINICIWLWDFMNTYKEKIFGNGIYIFLVFYIWYFGHQKWHMANWWFQERKWL